MGVGSVLTRMIEQNICTQNRRDLATCCEEIMSPPTAAFASSALLAPSHENALSTRRTRCGNGRRRFMVYCGTSSSTTATRKRLHKDLMRSLSGLNRGLLIDADSRTESDEESDVEDIVEALESSLSSSSDNDNNNNNGAPLFDWDLRYGDWDLAYTSSSLTRYAGGLTGMHKLLPGGVVGNITLNVSDEVSQWVFTERMTFELFGREFKVNVVINGRVEASNGGREVWMPEKADMFGWKFYAETWKSLRAFTNTTVTYMDEFVKIHRGTTGSAIVFVRPQAEALKDVDV